jgi:hypothetical protein
MSFGSSKTVIRIRAFPFFPDAPTAESEAVSPEPKLEQAGCKESKNMHSKVRGGEPPRRKHGRPHSQQQ